MDYKVLKEKFFSGTTSREEEDEFRRYLMGDELLPEAKEDKEMMLAMLQPVVCDCGAEMEEISAMIDNLAADDAVPVVHASPVRKVVIRYLVPAISVAAVLALLFMVVPYSGNNIRQGSDPVAVNGKSDAVLAVAETDQPHSATNIVTIILEEPEPVVGKIEVTPELPKKINVQVTDNSLLADVADEDAGVPVAETDQPHSATNIVTIVLEEPEPVVGKIEVTPELPKKINVQVTDNSLLADVADEDAGVPVDEKDAVMHSGKLKTFTLSEGETDLLPENGKVYVGDLRQIAYDNGYGNDTFSDPEDAVTYLESLFEVFSGATSCGIEEQSMHLKQFVVLENVP